MKSKINPCLWFDNQAEEAANFYIGIFPNSKITQIARYSDAGKEHHGKNPGEVMLVSFELDGQSFSGLNGGPHFKFSEAISFVIECNDQDEINRYADALSTDPQQEQCGWVKDKFGLSWQIVPAIVSDLFKDHESPATQRAMAAMMQMKRLDIAALEKAYRGE